MVERKELIFTCLFYLTVQSVSGMAAVQTGRGNENARAYDLGNGFKLIINENNITISVDNKETNLLTGFISHNRNTAGITSCQGDGGSTENGYCFRWENGPRLEISANVMNSSRNATNFNCVTVNWTVPVEAGHTGDTPEDCYSMERYFWFGGFEEPSQVWPINNFQIGSVPFVTGEGNGNLAFGDVLEPILISSSGTGIYVHESTPLYLSINYNQSKLICLKGHVGPDTPFFEIDQPHLIYDICRSTDIKTLWKSMADRYIPKPSSFPSVDVIRHPIWCTWAIFKSNINQGMVLKYAETIRQHNFSISQLEIDDNWTPRYGDFVFNTYTFPNAKELITNLTRLGAPATVWVHWFFNNDSSAFNELTKAGYLIKEFGGHLPLLVSWWEGAHAGVLDFTNPAAVEWYLDRMRGLRDNYNVTSFKFDSGEIKWIINKRYSVNRTLLNPNYLTQKYAEAAHAADLVNNRQEVRIGFRSQAYSNMVRIFDRNSDWSHNYGIKTVIPTSLVFGLMGYPFILPDLIGGNAYATPLPEPELFVRWLQVSVFLPVLQFSIGPWAFNNDTITEITRKFVSLHEQYANKIIDLVYNAQQTGEPIVRPLWWIAPTDVDALTLDTEFLLGDDLLVAPVLDKGARSRDVYLPSGQWHDELRNVTIAGGQWLRNYRAELHELPYFTKLL